MRCNRLPEILVVSCLLCGLGNAGSAQTRPPLSISGQHLTLAGTLKRIEAGPHAALFAGDDGRQYVLDLSQAKIVLPGGAHLPLLAGTRGYVSGLGNPDGSITVSRLQVLPAPLPALPPVVAASDEPVDLTVRGTVEAIDLEHGAFVLRINTHTRTVFVTPDTDVSGLGGVAGGQFPVQPGRRVTVGGSLQPDGSVLAGLLTQKEDVDYQTAATQPNRVLFGTVSSPANKLAHRDIKIRSADGGTETKIGIPRGIPIRRAGLQISVYDLSRRDSVRVTGRRAGTDFHAARIDVLAPPLGASSASEPPTPLTVYPKSVDPAWWARRNQSKAQAILRLTR